MNITNSLMINALGRVLAEHRDATFQVDSLGSVIQVELERLSDAQYLYDLKSVPLPGSRRLGSALHRWLMRSGLTLRVFCRGRPLAQIGAAAKPGFLGFLLGLPGLETSWVNSIRFLTGFRW
jgi:hypothetical protein